LAAAGASVAVNYAPTGAAREESAGRGDPTPWRPGNRGAGDVSSQRSGAAVRRETRRLGALDVLVNNAAVYKFGQLGRPTEEEFPGEFNTNVLESYLMIREAVKYFGPRGGSIINIGSLASPIDPAHLSIYTATKSASMQSHGGSSTELGPRQIRVNSINPGATDTLRALAADGADGVGRSDFEKQ